MLRDRRVLIERDLKIAQDAAADMYLEIVINDDNVHSEEYQVLRNRVTQLQFDLDMVNKLIDQGNP